MPRRYTQQEDRCLRDNYGRLGLRAVAGAFEREFGYARSQQALAVRAHKLGLHVTKASDTRKSGIERKVYWSREPEMTAWMLEHDHGRIGDTADAFEREFGFRLTRSQVTLFRQTHGTSSRRNCSDRWGDNAPPVGTERVSKGYVIVKVADRPKVKGSKDNWPFKHVWLWEQAHGPLPAGMQVIFADHDRRNFDIGNLVAVPKRICALLNQRGAMYHDAESLAAEVNLARLKLKIGDVRMAARRCGVCGREFKPEKREQAGNKTCPECLAAGRKARGDFGTGTCERCGARFEMTSGSQRMCPRCGTPRKRR